MEKGRLKATLAGQLQSLRAGSGTSGCPSFVWVRLFRPRATGASGHSVRAVTTPSSIGNNGYSWSSTVSGTDALRLNFNPAWLDPGSPNSRAWGGGSYSQ